MSRSGKTVWPAVLATCILSACAGKDFAEVPDNVPVVPVDAVVNSLKCGLATALVEDRLGRSGLLGSRAVITLKANIVTFRSANGEISAGLPVSTGTVTPKLSGGFENTLTRNSQLDFAISLSKADATICQQTGPVMHDAGFSLWLREVVVAINRSVAGEPKASIAKYTYESDFILKRTAGAGLDVQIVPVKASASATASRSDLQNLKIELAAVRLKPDGSGYVDGSPPWGADWE